MTKLSQWSLMGVMVGALAASACTTKDTRPGVMLDDFERDRGLGEQCTDTLLCADGLTCVGFDAMTNTRGVCTPERFATACEAEDCGEGVCNARGETGMVQTFCRCPSGEAWDGDTCVMGGPDAEGSETETECPEEELAPGVVDEDTANCPTGTFCTASTGGDCLRPNLTISGSINSSTIGTSFADLAGVSSVSCVRKYFDDDSGDSDGITIVISGAASSSIAVGSSSITIDLSMFDGVAGGTAIVWPQMSAPDPASDAGFVDVTITGTGTTAFDGAAIGGEFNVSLSSGPDEDEDDLIDDGTGFVSGSFFLGLGGSDFITGAFTIEDCSNMSVATPM